MPGILVRNLEPEVIERLRSRAGKRGRSLQREVKTILERSAEETSMEEFRRAALKIQRKLTGRKHTDSAVLIRENRGE